MLMSLYLTFTTQKEIVGIFCLSTCFFFLFLYIIWNNTDNNNNFGMAQRCLVGHPTSENKIKTRIT